MNRQQLLKKLDVAWLALKESYAGLSEGQMIEPGVAGTWSVKDLLGHVTTWEEEALKYLPVIRQGQKPPRYLDQYGGLNVFNAKTAAAKRALPLADVLQALDETHERLVSYLLDVPEELIERETPFRRRLRLDTYSHYPEHTRAIREWRQRLPS